MAKNWYPIINENLCNNCNVCVDFCLHGVFGKGDLYPKVINPDRCVEFCLGCSKICDFKAITFFGDEDIILGG